jgi:hypothetical protein
MTRTSILAGLTALLLFGCSDAASTELPESGATTGEEASVCEPGADQTCNDNAAISSLHGACQPNRTCLCNPGIDKNPATGRCL